MRSGSGPTTSLPARRRGYIYDDEGVYGGLKPGSMFVIAGDQNSDPLDGDSIPGSIQQLTEHPLVNTKVTPESEGAVEASALQGGANLTHSERPRVRHGRLQRHQRPATFGRTTSYRRVNLRIQDAGVFWPRQDDPLFQLTGTFPFPSSDHRLVWVDVRIVSVLIR